MKTLTKEKRSTCSPKRRSQYSVYYLVLFADRANIQFNKKTLAIEDVMHIVEKYGLRKYTPEAVRKWTLPRVFPLNPDPSKDCLKVIVDEVEKFSDEDKARFDEESTNDNAPVDIHLVIKRIK